MRRHTKQLVALFAAAGLLVAACGSDSEDAVSATTSGGDAAVTTTVAMTDETMTSDTMTGESMAPETTDMAMAGGTTEDGASTLRAGLTSLLQEHVYLAGITVETAVDAGGNMDDPSVQAAAAALDENTVALSKAVGSVAGPENEAAFLELWRNHIGFFVDYTLGKATTDQAKVDKALQDLAGYEQAAGAFFEEVTGGKIKAADLVKGLDGHIKTLTVAIDAVVAGQPDAFDKLQMAAHHMYGAAQFLADGIAAAAPDMFAGDTDGAASETRATLTDLLQEHAYLAGIAIEQAVEAGGDMNAPAVTMAVATLDANSVALSEVISSVAGPDKGEAFLGLWREHIGFFVDYTLGLATGDDAMAQKALTDLDGYRAAAGAFFEEITAGNLKSADVEESLTEHVATLSAAIDALVAKDGTAFAKLRVAAQHMPMTALAISTAVVAATS